MNQTSVNTIGRLISAGFTNDEAIQLRRISMTLHRWDEQECGDGNDYASWAIERDETTGFPYRCVYPHTGTMRRTKIADREAGALRRLARIMASHKRHLAYHQTDCRGCALYIVRKADLRDEGDKILPIDQYYTRGIAVIP